MFFELTVNQIKYPCILQYKFLYKKKLTFYVSELTTGIELFEIKTKRARYFTVTSNEVKVMDFPQFTPSTLHEIF